MTDSIEPLFCTDDFEADAIDLESEPISEEDFRSIVGLLGRIAGMNDPLPVRKRALMDALGRIIGASKWIWTTSTNFAPGELPTGIAVSSGGFEEHQLALLLESSQDLDYPVKENDRMIEDILSHQHVTRTRSDWLSDEELYTSAHWALYRKPAGTDHYLFSLYRVGTDYVSGIGFHRLPGEPDFTNRERRIVHVVASEIDWLHTADIPDRDVAENAIRLSPRLRVVLVLLLKGWNRKRIAEQLGISPNTVAGYIKDVYKTFGVSSQPALISRVAEGDGGDLVRLDSA